MFARVKRSSLSSQRANYGAKKFYNTVHSPIVKRLQHTTRGQLAKTYKCGLLCFILAEDLCNSKLMWLFTKTLYELLTAPFRLGSIMARVLKTFKVVEGTTIIILIKCFCSKHFMNFVQSLLG
jgi:hypothetical protein